MKYEFTKDYLTGIGEIDKEHARLFEIANECYELVMDDAAVDRFDHIVALLDELRSYAATHFAHEEEYMERIQYERRFSERYQHLRFIQKLSGINLDDIDENQQEYLLKLLDFLAHWLYGHIKVMDCRIPREEDIGRGGSICGDRGGAAGRSSRSRAPCGIPCRRGGGNSGGDGGVLRCGQFCCTDGGTGTAGESCFCGSRTDGKSLRRGGGGRSTTRERFS